MYLQSSYFLNRKLSESLTFQQYLPYSGPWERITSAGLAARFDNRLHSGVASRVVVHAGRSGHPDENVDEANR